MGSDPDQAGGAALPGVRGFFDWLRTGLLNLEGQPHQRRSRPVSRAFTQRDVDLLRPFMRAKARELIDSFAGAGSCEFVTAFADPYPG